MVEYSKCQEARDKHAAHTHSKQSAHRACFSFNSQLILFLRGFFFGKIQGEERIYEFKRKKPAGASGFQHGGDVRPV
jgi:hypothetical protein